jgi:hypothetical protein
MKRWEVQDVIYEEAYDLYGAPGIFWITESTEY